MNWKLAQRLLANVMQWAPEDDVKERPILQSLAAFKYDDYDYFSPGMRFIESLALWLKQFETIQERRLAYEFVKKRMVYISSQEMFHLVTIAYPDFIRPYLIKQIAPNLRVKEWKIKKIVESSEFKIAQKKSLFLALSDSARIDEFRRSNPSINNEQVLRSHEIQSFRAEDMVEKLKEGLRPLLSCEPVIGDAKFRFVFLIDDFSGSGFTCKSKIGKFMDSTKKELKDLFNVNDLRVCLLLYVASDRATKSLQKAGQEILGEIPLDILIIDPLPDYIRIDKQKDGKFVDLLKKYYDPVIQSKHYKMGKTEKPFLGFDESGLPLVLEHNTPNNSIALLWFPEDPKAKLRGLFPRISRHRED